MNSEPCPLCGNEATITIQEGTFPLRCLVSCPSTCIEFVLVDNLSELLERIGPKGRKTLSCYVQGIAQGWGLPHLSTDQIRRIIEGYAAAEQVMIKLGDDYNLLRHSGEGFDSYNPLFFVEKNGQRMTLRVYDSNRDEFAIKSELEWLNFLNSRNLPVLKPVVGEDGNAIGSVHLETGVTRCYVLYHWLEGITVHRLRQEKRQELNHDYIEKFGACLAQMHGCARAFIPPPWFVSPRYDLQKLKMVIQKSNLAGIEDHVQKLMKIVENTPENPDVFGMIHPEIGANNILVNGNELGIIDFVKCGLGFYWTDILTAKQLLFRDTEYDIFLRSYAQYGPLPVWFADCEELHNAQPVWGRWLEANWPR